MHPYEHDIQQCLQVFHTYGIILYPTDTIWGLGCPADDEIALEKITQLKNRPATKSFILLMTDVKMLRYYIANPLPDLEELIKPFEEPTTFIYSQGINVPNALLGEDGSLAVRITKDPFCRSLIKRMRKPLVSTSANISGEPGTAVFSALNADIVTGADYVVQWRQQEITEAKASAILRLENNGTLIKIR